MRGDNYVSEISSGYWNKSWRSISVSVSCPRRELRLVLGTSQPKGGYKAGVALPLSILKNASSLGFHIFKGKK